METFQNSSQKIFHPSKISKAPDYIVCIDKLTNVKMFYEISCGNFSLLQIIRSQFIFPFSFQNIINVSLLYYCILRKN